MVTFSQAEFPILSTKSDILSGKGAIFKSAIFKPEDMEEENIKDDFRYFRDTIGHILSTCEPYYIEPVVSQNIMEGRYSFLDDRVHLELPNMEAKRFILISKDINAVYRIKKKEKGGGYVCETFFILSKSIIFAYIRTETYGKEFSYTHTKLREEVVKEVQILSHFHAEDWCLWAFNVEAILKFGWGKKVDIPKKKKITLNGVKYKKLYRGEINLLDFKELQEKQGLGSGKFFFENLGSEYNLVHLNV